jgi:hypothetical protein
MHLGFSRVAVFVFALLSTMAGCGDSVVQPADRSENLERGPTGGKADSAGTCNGYCGKKSAGSCWCDEQCTSYGDCCADKKAVCDNKKPSCQGYCGKKSADGCWCDKYCANYGDCCADKKDLCDAPQCPQVAQPSADFCPGGKVEPQTDSQGCVTGYTCNNFCGGIAAIPCPAGFECKLDGSYPDAGGKCVPKATKCYKGGCSGQICSDKQGVISTCEWKSYYLCFQYSSCGSFGAGSACAWEQTSYYKACMKYYGQALP